MINLAESPLDLPPSIPQVLNLLQRFWVLSLSLLLWFRDDHVKVVPITLSPLDCALLSLDLFYYVLELSLRLQNLSTDLAALHPRLEFFIGLAKTCHFKYYTILSGKLAFSSVHDFQH